MSKFDLRKALERALDDVYWAEMGFPPFRAPQEKKPAGLARKDEAGE